MKYLKTASRYAKAIYPVAKENNAEELLLNDMTFVIATLEQCRDLRLAVESPIISTSVKIRLVKEIYQEKVSELTMKFLILLIKKRRERLITDICHCLKTYIYNDKYVEEGLVITAHELDQESKKSIQTFLNSIHNKNVIIKYQIDKNLIGGLKIQLDTTVYDTTVQTQLVGLKKNLIS